MMRSTLGALSGSRMAIVLVGVWMLGGVAVAVDETPFPTSQAEYAAMKLRAKGGQLRDAASLPDWRGLWEAANKNSFDGRSDFIKERSPAPLSPAYVALYDKTREKMKNGVFYDQTAACLPAGFPRMQIEPYSKEWIVTPEKVMLVAELNNEVRRIYTDGRQHIPDDEAYPLWEGDSIGFWDGDTLVVHTNHLRADAQGYQREGPPQSDQISTVERIRRTGDRIVDEMTVYDPVGLAHPWRVVHQFHQIAPPGSGRIDEWACEENNKYVATPDGGTHRAAPR